MENRKRQHSRTAIERTFIALLQEKSLEKITVVEICEAAEVNRSTFYSNYLDIYDLMEQVSERFFGEMFHQCVASLGEPNPNGREGTKEIVECALTATLEQKALCKVLLCASGKTNFTEKLLDTLLEWSRERYVQYSGINTRQFQLEYTILLGGILVLWKRWVKEDCQEPIQALTKIICRYIEANTASIWNRSC